MEHWLTRRRAVRPQLKREALGVRTSIRAGPALQNLKQGDLDRLLTRTVKNVAKMNGWRSVGGFAYRSIGPLFFTLIVGGVTRQGSAYVSLRVKWYSLDDRLWEVLDLKSNASGPVSLRANGAFTVTGQEILVESVPDCDWSEKGVEDIVSRFFSKASEAAATVAQTIATIEDYVAFIERQNAIHMARYPESRANLWLEKMLLALEQNDRERAAAIARDRVAAGDGGGFGAWNGTLYQLALRYLGADA
jgi:hypothetical protein